MKVRIPEAPRGLAVGLDLPWQGPYGIVDGAVSDRTVRFLKQHASRFASLFISWQPRDRGVPRLEEVQPIWDALFEAVPIPHRVLHQTAFNLSGANYDRSALIAFTNAAIARYGFLWVNEDLGNWSVGGWPLPYPQPPPLCDTGIAHCIRQIVEVDRALDAPLVVEFPGYEVLPATGDAYDGFRRIIEGAGVRCTLDTGHLLTWRWLQGHRGEALLEGLDRLPLANCVELHCAGTAIEEGMLIDAHHGLLLEVQRELASRLMALCPNLHLVTYEDPRYGPDGSLPDEAEQGLRDLESRVDQWLGTSPASVDGCHQESAGLSAVRAPWEAELLATYQSDTEVGVRWRQQILERQARGIGRIRELYADFLGADPDATVLAFLQSPWGASWSEYAWACEGRCIEDAFGCFVAPGSEAHLLACTRALAVHPNPPFVLPDGFRRAPGGWFQVVEGVLYAAVAGRLVHGPITPLLERILDGERPAGAEAAVQRFVELGLVA